MVVFVLAACSQPESDVLDLPLSAVDTFSRGNNPAPIEFTYNRYNDLVIAIEGIRLGLGLPAGLGSHQYVGLHEPQQQGKEFRVFLSGNVPPQHGQRYRVVGRIEPVGSSYEIAVKNWEELPLK